MTQLFLTGSEAKEVEHHYALRFQRKACCFPGGDKPRKHRYLSERFNRTLSREQIVRSAFPSREKCPHWILFPGPSAASIEATNFGPQEDQRKCQVVVVLQPLDNESDGLLATPAVRDAERWTCRQAASPIWLKRGERFLIVDDEAQRSIY